MAQYFAICVVVDIFKDFYIVCQPSVAERCKLFLLNLHPQLAHVYFFWIWLENRLVSQAINGSTNVIVHYLFIFVNLLEPNDQLYLWYMPQTWYVRIPLGFPSELYFRIIMTDINPSQDQMRSDTQASPSQTQTF